MGRTVSSGPALPVDSFVMEKFKVLDDVSGDVGLESYGATVTEAFINAAAGMYSLIANPEQVLEKKTISVIAESSSIDGLLVRWLNELIFHFDTYGFLGKKIIIDEFFASRTIPSGDEAARDRESCRMRASVSGEEFDPGRHEGGLLIKAATYHRLKVEEKDDHWEIDVIFDI